jgi:hypothetical protein
VPTGDSRTAANSDDPYEDEAFRLWAIEQRSK